MSLRASLILLGASLVLLTMGSPKLAWAQPETAAASLDQLLQQVRSRTASQGADDQAREQAFLAARNRQGALLSEARDAEAAALARSKALETQLEENERLLAQLEDQLRTRLGTLGEFTGVFRQVAGDTRAQFRDSLITAQFPKRLEPLDPLAQGSDLPSRRELEDLWFALQQDMTESGKVVRFRAPVVGADGTVAEQEVTRVGAFVLASGGQYLRWLPDVSKISALDRQPPRQFVKTLQTLDEQDGTFSNIALDPSRGSLLSVLVKRPTMRERVDAGGWLGYGIIILGVLAGFIGLVRMVQLFVVSVLVQRQRQAPDQPTKGNPLGRVLSVYFDNRHVEPELLERKLEEAVIRESGRLERFLWAVKIIAAVTPLMGLLGTVTGMITTFHSITLFGTGDPKLMAGGISEALATTMLGLSAAIPLVLLHSLAKNTARRVLDVLYEQSAGLIATVSEREGG